MKCCYLLRRLLCLPQIQLFLATPGYSVPAPSLGNAELELVSRRAHHRATKLSLEFKARKPSLEVKEHDTSVLAPQPSLTPRIPR